MPVSSIHICPAIAEMPLQPAPIPPAWVRRGRPEATAREIARSQDGAQTCLVWACTDGAFEWQFGVDETVHILEGAVTVSDEAGRPTRLGPGDVAVFQAGSRSVWEVHGHVRKLAICRHPVPRPVGLALRVHGRLRGLAGRAVTAVAARVPAGSVALMLFAIS